MSEESNRAFSGDSLRARLLVAQATKKYGDGPQLTDVSMVYEANVLALLDVAAAIRELREPESDVTAFAAAADFERKRVINLSALLVRAVRELADSGSPGQNRLAAELAGLGGIEL